MPGGASGGGKKHAGLFAGDERPAGRPKTRAPEALDRDGANGAHREQGYYELLNRILDEGEARSVEISGKREPVRTE